MHDAVLDLAVQFVLLTAACMVAGSILYLRFLFPTMRTLFGYN